jgi:dehydrogenase/reductase SDR family protein 12
MFSSMRIAGAIDTVLDRTIAPGYGDVGLHVRRHLPGWPADPPRMDGKVVVVTGAASGIGEAACRGFAQLGASVRAVARDERRARDAVRQILAAAPAADVRGLSCDVASLGALRSLADRLIADEERLDVLVNNAGTMPDQRQRSPDGHELMFATHVLAPFGLTAWLTELLARGAPSRVINVSSGGMYAQRLPADDFQSDETRYSSTKLYARTKREEVVITELWAEKLASRGIVVHAMHPGWADTKGVREWLPVFRAVTGLMIRSPEEGADTIIWLGGAPEAVNSTGGFWHDRRARPTHYLLGASDDDPRDRRRLWDLCRSLVASDERPDPPPLVPLPSGR